MIDFVPIWPTYVSSILNTDYHISQILSEFSHKAFTYDLFNPNSIEDLSFFFSVQVFFFSYNSWNFVIRQLLRLIIFVRLFD